MRFFTFLFSPISIIMDTIDRELWLRECAEFDDMRGFSIRDLEEERESWVSIKVQPAES